MSTRLWCGVIVVLALARPALAADSVCDLPSGASMRVVQYVDSGSAASPLCSQQGDAAPVCKLSGWLYKPAGAGPFPTVLLSHSAASPRHESDYCQITEFFVRRGYLVFQPLRRGYRGDAGIGQNSGELPATTLSLLAAGQPARSPLAAELLAECNSGAATLTAAERDCIDTKLQESQADELRRALQAIRKLPTPGATWVGPVAAVGHAEGAAITALLGDIWGRDPALGVRAGILLSPAERIWDADHATLKARLIEAVEHRAHPLAFLQPANAAHVGPTRELADAAVKSGDFQLLAALMPNVLGLGAQASPEQVEEFFATRPESVDLWGPVARQFLQTQGVGDPPDDQPEPTGVFTAAHNPDVTSMCNHLTLGTRITEERYYDPTGTPKPELCDDLPGGGLVCRLKGILYVPQGARDAPAVILNYGGSDTVYSENGFCTMTEYFNRHGFVVFLIRRRGVTQSDGDHPENHFQFQNTGKTFPEVEDAVRAALQSGGPMPREAEPYVAKCHLAWIDPEPEDWDCLSGELMRDEATENGEAVKWLKRQPAPGGGNLVDPGKVALVGHSNGGQVVIHAGADLSGSALPNAIIALQPAEKSWGNSYRADLLRRSVERAQVPFTIFRPANSPNLFSTEVLGKIAANHRKQFLTQVFPPMLEADGSDDPDTHNHFVKEFDQVVKWGTAARRYMQLCGIE